MSNKLFFYTTFLKRLLFVHDCKLCKKALTLKDQFICQKCLAELTPLSGAVCQHCSHPLSTASTKKRFCNHCCTPPVHFESNKSLFPFTGKVRHLIHEAKYQVKPWLLKIFAPHLSKWASELAILKDADLLVPVPLSHESMRKRGFNQAKIIANLIRKEAGLPIANHILRKSGKGHQMGLRKKDRLTKQKGAFNIRNSNLIAGKHIVLVDDIFTSGSTVNECARLLKTKGAKLVHVLTLARTL